MPLEENKNNQNFSPLKVDIDPVFKGVKNSTQSQQNLGVSGILENQQYVPAQKSDFEAGSVNELHNNKNSIRTYRDDIASAIQASHLSSINIAMAEDERMHSKIQTSGKIEAEEIKSSYSKNRIFLLISIILIVVGILVVLVTYFIDAKPETVTQNTTLSFFITAEYKDELDTNKIVKERFTYALASKINDIQIPVNNLYSSYITTGTSTTKRLVTTQEFITLANLRVPNILLRTLVPDFMVGMYSFGQDLPFVIFKTSSFENTYAGMIEWEKNLEKDFSVLFRLNNSGGGSLADSLTPTTARKFEDGVINNKDVRLIRDADGKIIFVYAIIDKNIIVITVNDKAFKEINNRLNKEKGLKR